MRKIFAIISVLFTVQFCAVAQNSGSHAAIDGILNTVPAQNSGQLNKSMDAITALGETGIAEMAAMLKPYGKGDNTSLEYAIGGYTYYVIQPGKEAQRATAVKAYCTALDKVPGVTNKQFIIKQLQQMGDGGAVTSIAKYLTDEDLAGAAARALAQINTSGAQTALSNALLNAGGPAQLSIAEALGYLRYTPAVPLLKKMMESDNAETIKVSLYALARIGSADAATVLQQAAQKAGYTFDNTEATSAYVLYLHQLAANDNSKLAETLAAKLLVDAGKQVHTKITALEVLAEVQGPKSLALLHRAVQDDDIKYRAAALSFAVKFQSPATDKEWLALLPNLSIPAQVQVIDFISHTKDATVLPALINLLKDKNAGVRMAAIAAAGKIGQQSALHALLAVMKTGSADEVAAVKNAILIMKGDGVTASVVSALPSMPSVAKAALLDVISARSYDKGIDVVIAQLQSADAAVHKAAAAALPAVVKQQDLPKLFILLNGAQSADVQYFQQAVIAASSNIKDTAQRTTVIVTAMKGAGAGKQYLYLDLLSSIGSSNALAIIQSTFENGDAETKNAAIAALSKTTSANAARILLHFAQQKTAGYSQDALNGYVTVIRQSSLPADEKLLMLKEAMVLAGDDAQQKAILEETGECNTFLAMLFAGQYLDNAAVQQEAAHAVMNIALSHNEFTGSIVKTLLTKAADVLQGKDADYEKQSIKKHIAEMPGDEGFVSMFNGNNLSGWKGLVENPVLRAKMPADTLAVKQAEADKVMRDGWMVKDGLLIFTGNGENLCTVKKYSDFDMYVDWKILKDGDAGIYLRGSPQVQIWDTSRRSVGAQVGSGGLYNNQVNKSTPIVLADNAIGEWNSFHIIMRGEKVTVYLNGVLVTDNITLENYWDRAIPIFPKEQIELQAHGNEIFYRDLYIKELTGADPVALSSGEKKDGFNVLFDGSNLDQWTGDKSGYKIDGDGAILVDTLAGNPGNMYTKQEYNNFTLRFEFQLTPGANNGIGIRAPLYGDAAYVGMEIQVLDNEADMYKDLHAYQYHGSVYGVIPAKRGFLKPTGQWNYEEITAVGPNIKVTLNGEVILDGNIDEASKNGTADHNQHPGLKRQSGHIGFLGHGSVVRFRNVRVKEL